VIDEEPGAVTIRQAAEMGMFPTLDAARKAVHRANLSEVGWRYAAKTYRIEDLAACQSRKQAKTMTDSEVWRPVPGYPGYEASDIAGPDLHGRFRSVDREQHGRTYRGTVLSTRVSNKGYVLVDLHDTQGHKKTRSAHTVLLETWVGPRPRGHEACHANDVSTDNRLENLRWDDPPANVEDTFRNGRPRAAPKPDRPCVRCGAVIPPGRGGRRCHTCVTEIGEQAADWLRSGVSLDEVADKMDYPHLSGLHQLARVYGGYGVPQVSLGPGEGKSPTALATLRHWLRRSGGHAR
jgi:HNH endonuclease/NUMOD4 motif